MPRAADPAVRQRLVDVTAALLANGDDVTLRKVADVAGTSTMAVYTHFDGMDGLWFAVREQAFGELTSRLADVAATDDPVADLVATGAAYVRFALAEPVLYQAMFDIGRSSAQPPTASISFAVLVAAVERSVTEGRLSRGSDALAAATRFWAMSHGVISLVLSGALPPEAVDGHLPPMIAALLVQLGDGPRRAPRSVARGWEPDRVAATD